MDANLVLDALLVVIVLLFVPIGLWRGGTKEVFVTAAVLLGAAGAAAWAAPWGDDLAAALDVRQATARFLVAACSLVLSTLLLGYGAGLALGRADPSLPGRAAGGLIAGINGVLLAAFGLAFVERYLLDDPGGSALDDGLVARVLLRHFGLVLLAAGAAALAAVVAGAVLARLRPDPADLILADPPMMLPGITTRPVRVPRTADADKQEPPDHTPAPRVVSGLDDAPAPTPVGLSPRGDPHPTPRERHESATVAVEAGWPRRLEPLERDGTSDLQPPERPGARVTNLWETRGWSPAVPPVPDSPPSLPADRCLACGSPFAPDEEYCPECGAGR